MLQTIQGIYRNGKIELLEFPQDITESPVFVTFVTPQPIKTSSLLMSFGMFANDPQSTEADFKAAEFQDDIGDDPNSDEVGAKVYISELANKNLMGESTRKFLILPDSEPLIHEIDDILNKLSSADYRIAKNQGTIDSLKEETQEILATLQAIVG